MFPRIVSGRVLLWSALVFIGLSLFEFGSAASAQGICGSCGCCSAPRPCCTVCKSHYQPPCVNADAVYGYYPTAWRRWPALSQYDGAPPLAVPHPNAEQLPEPRPIEGRRIREQPPESRPVESRRLPERRLEPRPIEIKQNIPDQLPILDTVNPTSYRPGR